MPQSLLPGLTLLLSMSTAVAAALVLLALAGCDGGNADDADAGAGGPDGNTPADASGNGSWDARVVEDCDPIDLGGASAVIELPEECIVTPDYCPDECTDVGFVPLSELGTDSYHGIVGGLYCGGSNLRPSVHEQAGLDLAANLVPRAADGTPDPNGGKVVLLSIGMSNTMQEFGAYLGAHENDAALDDRLVVVNGALSGQASEQWAGTDTPWDNLTSRLSARSVTDQQVAVAWIKLTRLQVGQPCREATGERSCFPAGEKLLYDEILTVLQRLKTRFPNLELAYLSSRIYGGYVCSGPSPEPFAYQSAFAAKALIVNQIVGDPELNYDRQSGEVKVPWLAWGPYLWANGTNPREDDGLIWVRDDFESDGTHPAAGARQKVADMLHAFFSTDSTARLWYLANP